MGELATDGVGVGEVGVDPYGVEEAGDVAGIAAAVDGAAAMGGDQTAGLGGMDMGEVTAALGFVVRMVAVLIEYGQSVEEVDIECVAMGSHGRTWVGKMARQDKRGLQSTDRHDEVDSLSK